MTASGPTWTEDPHVTVRNRYAQIASTGGCCTPTTAAPGGPAGCCSGGDGGECVGYTSDELAGLPTGADLGLGCGNPTALLALLPDETVVDLGSGAGIDCFLAAKRVGPGGRVIGVDMTPEMVERARRNAARGSYPNVEFRLGEIEHLPLADGVADVVISNCVINLVPDKSAVYREAYRVLQPGGRFAVSDLVATRPISEKDRQDPELWAGCSSGALEVEEVRRRLREVGFWPVSIELRGPAEPAASLSEPASLGVLPADIRATKPKE